MELEAECRCPVLERDDWHEVESDWSDIVFLRTAVPALLGVPVRFEAARRRLYERARQLGCQVPEDPMFLLGPGRFRRPLLLEVEAGGQEAPDLWRPGGFAYSRLAQAPYGAVRREARVTFEAARERYGRAPDSVWVWYLTCARCSAARGFETLFLAHYRSLPAAVS